jgi:hypothetical protein
MGRAQGTVVATLWHLRLRATAPLSADAAEAGGGRAVQPTDEQRRRLGLQVRAGSPNGQRI